VSTERAYVERSAADALLKRLVPLVQGLRMGPGLSPGVDMGPLYALSARDQVAKDVDGAIASGARSVAGGTRPTDPALAKGAFYPPTVLDHVQEGNPIAREEIFGPVLPVLTYDDWDEAIRLANDSRYGLSSYVFTRDLSLAEKAIREIRFGETYVNRVGPENPQGYHAAFRQSGLGGEGTVWGVRDYLQLKSVYVDWKEPHSADYFLPYSRRGT
jgi:acyl-CoA reductase-like NAD-dependent aldehyde dehydrogenase